MTLRVLAGLAALPVLAAAQTSANRDLDRGRPIPVAAASKLDTKSFAQPIRPTVGPARDVPENPSRRLWESGGAPNALPFGRATDRRRVSDPLVRFPGIGQTNLRPPDPDLAVSSQWIVQVVNSDLAFFEKATGRRTFQQSSGAFFAGLGAGAFQFDPKVVFDPVTKRFFLLYLEFVGSDSKFLLAVSDDDDPNGSWNRYRIEAKFTEGSNTWWCDYPGMGVTNDKLLLTGNLFPLEGSGGYGGAEVLSLPLAPLLSGTATTALTYRDPQAYTIKFPPTALTETGYGVTWHDTSSLRLYAVTGTGASTRVVSSDVTIPQVTGPQGAIPGPNGTSLDSLPGMLFNASWTNGRLVAAHGVKASNSSRQGLRWYDVKTGNWPQAGSLPELVQTGVVDPPEGAWFHMPAVARNRRGDVSVLFSRTTSSTTADLMIAARKSTDRLGTLGRPTQFATSSGVYTGFRWGDYFGVVVDPNDQTTFWGVGMLGGANGVWATEIAKWRVASYGDAAVTNTLLAAAPLAGQGTVAGGSRANLGAVDGRFLSVASSRVNGLGQVASVDATFQAPSMARGVQWYRLTMDAALPAGTTVFVYAADAKTGRLTLLDTRRGAGNSLLIERTEAAAAAAFGSDGKARFAVRVLAPERPGAPGRFILPVDRLRLEYELVSVD